MKIFFLVFLALNSPAEAKMTVVATTADLAALVSTVGGQEVVATSIAKGTQDPHEIEAKPSFMVQVRNANLVVAQGLELETAWLLPLIRGARNPGVNPGSKGFLELGPSLDPIEKATGAVSRAEGDVHPGGNPHFQVDPVRMGKAAVIVADRLAELDNAHAELYRKNAAAWQKQLEEKTKSWQARLAKTGIKEAVSYHKTLSYFFERFGIKNSYQLEPKPGIPPTASHLLEVIAGMKAKKIRLVLIENFFDSAAGEKIKLSVPDARIERIPVSVGGEPAIHSTEDLVERLVQAVEAAK